MTYGPEFVMNLISNWWQLRCYSKTIPNHDTIVREGWKEKYTEYIKCTKHVVQNSACKFNVPDKHGEIRRFLAVSYENSLTIH